MGKNKKITCLIEGCETTSEQFKRHCKAVHNMTEGFFNYFRVYCLNNSARVFLKTTDTKAVLIDSETLQERLSILIKEEQDTSINVSTNAICPNCKKDTSNTNRKTPSLPTDRIIEKEVRSESNSSESNINSVENETEQQVTPNKRVQDSNINLFSVTPRKLLYQKGSVKYNLQEKGLDKLIPEENDLLLEYKQLLLVGEDFKLQGKAKQKYVTKKNYSQIN